VRWPFLAEKSVPAAPRPRLHFADGRLRSAGGTPVSLRGVSLFWSQWKPEFYNGGAIRTLARSWKIDVVRLPIAAMAPGFLDDPTGELRKAEAVIDAAIDAGLYAIVDWHGDLPHTDHAVAFFDAIAGKYGNDPHVIYETWNEPGADFDWSTDIAPHHERTARAIRAHAPDAPVILGIPNFCTAVDHPIGAPIPLENAAYAFHFYAGSHRQGLRDRLKSALEGGLCMFVSEWGCGEASGDGILDFEEARQWLRYLDENGISHVNWSLCDKREACAALRPGARCSGPWPWWTLTPSGRFVRSYLRNVRTRRRRRAAGRFLQADQHIKA
jgi:endoglucanase